MVCVYCIFDRDVLLLSVLHSKIRGSPNAALFVWLINDLFIIILLFIYAVFCQLGRLEIISLIVWYFLLPMHNTFL